MLCTCHCHVKDELMRQLDVLAENPQNLSNVNLEAFSKIMRYDFPALFEVFDSFTPTNTDNQVKENIATLSKANGGAIRQSRPKKARKVLCCARKTHEDSGSVGEESNSCGEEDDLSCSSLIHIARGVPKVTVSGNFSRITPFSIFLELEQMYPEYRKYNWMTKSLLQNDDLQLFCEVMKTAVKIKTESLHLVRNKLRRIEKALTHNNRWNIAEINYVLCTLYLALCRCYLRGDKPTLGTAWKYLDKAQNCLSHMTQSAWTAELMWAEGQCWLAMIRLKPHQCQQLIAKAKYCFNLGKEYYLNHPCGGEGLEDEISGQLITQCYVTELVVSLKQVTDMFISQRVEIRKMQYWFQFTKGLFDHIYKMECQSQLTDFELNSLYTLEGNFTSIVNETWAKMITIQWDHIVYPDLNYENAIDDSIVVPPLLNFMHGFVKVLDVAQPGFSLFPGQESQALSTQTTEEGSSVTFNDMQFADTCESEDCLL